MASQQRIREIAKRRREILVELDGLEIELRDATVETVRDGKLAAAPAARLAGVSRETLYKWLRAHGVATDTLAVERRLEARLRDLEGRWEAMVEAALAVREPASTLSRRGNVRSGWQDAQRVRSGKRRRQYAATVKDDARSRIERELADVIERGEGAAFAQARAELAEAGEIRERLAQLREARLPEFAREA